MNHTKKEKRFFNEDFIPSADSAQVFGAIENAILVINQNDNFKLEQKETSVTEEKRIKRLPKFLEINKVFVDKVKITESIQLKLDTNENDTYAISGESVRVLDLLTEENSSRKDNEAVQYIEKTTTVEKERLTYVKNNIRSKNKYFFKARDHGEFYQVGDSYYQDYKNGEKVFLFSNLGSIEGQQKTILGIASFIQYFESAKILIISSRLDRSFFKNILEESSPQNLNFSNEKLDCLIHEDIVFIDLDAIKKLNGQCEHLDYENILQNLSSVFDCILCDLPEVLSETTTLDFYLPVYKMANNVSLILKRNKASFSEIDKLMNYFHSYNIKIKGALFSEQGVTLS